MKKKSYIVSGIFLLVIGGISIGSLLAKDRDFSPNENRYLSGKPSFSFEKIMSGEFQENLEKYLNDQILGRDAWITVKTAIQKSCGDTDIGGAYVGKAGYDFEKIIPEDIDEKLVKRNVEALQKFCKVASEQIGENKMSVMIVPTSGLIMKEYLPKHAILFEQEKYIDMVQKAVGDGTFVDVRQTLEEHSDQEIYYHTDHHWTTYGAYLATQTWKGCRGMKGDDSQEGNLKFIEVADDFRGSLYSKILDYDSVYDKIYRLASNSKFEVMADGEDIGGFYQESKLREKDKYAYFFGGNYGEVSITAKAKDKNKAEKGNLLVIKDSFANAFVPLIADQYQHIYMIDLRYFNENIKQYIEEKDVSEVLVLYNISNFVTDRNIYKLGTVE